MVRETSRSFLRNNLARFRFARSSCVASEGIFAGFEEVPAVEECFARKGQFSILSKKGQKSRTNVKKVGTDGL